MSPAAGRRQLPVALMERIWRYEQVVASAARNDVEEGEYVGVEEMVQQSAREDEVERRREVSVGDDVASFEFPVLIIGKLLSVFADQLWNDVVAGVVDVSAIRQTVMHPKQVSARNVQHPNAFDVQSMLNQDDGGVQPDPTPHVLSL